jgi:hypothetical protein
MNLLVQFDHFEENDKLTDGYDIPPPHCLFHNRSDEWERIKVVKIRKLIQADNSVDFCLCFLQHIRVED